MNSSGFGLLVTTLIRLGRQDKKLLAAELIEYFSLQSGRRLSRSECGIFYEDFPASDGVLSLK